MQKIDTISKLFDLMAGEPWLPRLSVLVQSFISLFILGLDRYWWKSTADTFISFTIEMIFALIYFSEMNVDCTIWWLKNNGTAKASLHLKSHRCMTTLIHILYVYCYHCFPYVCFLTAFLALRPFLMGRQWTVDGWTEGLDASLKFCIRFLRSWLSVFFLSVS